MSARNQTESARFDWHTCGCGWQGVPHDPSICEVAAPEIPVDVYAVGVLSDIHRIAQALFDRDARLDGKRIGIVKHVLRVERRYLVGRVRKREWRNLRNSFNGYLAEHQGCAHNCGKGWTKRAARRRAERLCQRHIDAALASLDPPTPPAGLERPLELPTQPTFGLEGDHDA